MIAQPYIRGVLAELVDQADDHQARLSRLGGPGVRPGADGSAVALMSPPAATRASWPYDPAKAVATLKAHGWHVSQADRRPATSRDGGRECGAGIPAGTPIKFVWANVSSSISPVGALESRIFADDASRAAGIDVSFVTGTFSFLTAEYNDQNPAAGLCQRLGRQQLRRCATDYYPTQQGLLGAGGSLNLGGYTDPDARLMAASVSSPRRGDRRRGHISGPGLPGAVHAGPGLDRRRQPRVGGPADAFRAMTQQQYPFQFLYRVK